MRILLVFDKFKGTMTSHEVMDVVSNALSDSFDDVEIRQIPLADGGEGTLTIACEHGFQSVPVPTVDALGRPTQAAVGMRESEALLEMATLCGIATIDEEVWDGEETTSLGLGVAASYVLDQGVTHLKVSLGGSASADGGAGFICGLGAVLRDESGSPCAPNLRGLKSVSSVDLSRMHPRARHVTWEFLVDVDTPLTGSSGAAYMFGPQKRLNQSQIKAADVALRRWGRLVEKLTDSRIMDAPGSGAAGGVLVGARLICELAVLSGAKFIAEVTNLDEEIRQSDLVITGEGRLDEQSLRGKGPGYVLASAASLGVPAAVICGSSELDSHALHQAGLPTVVVVSTSQRAGTGREARLHPQRWLKEAALALAAQIDGGTSRLTHGHVSFEDPE